VDVLIEHLGMWGWSRIVSQCAKSSTTIVRRRPAGPRTAFNYLWLDGTTFADFFELSRDSSIDQRTDVSLQVQGGDSSVDGVIEGLYVPSLLA
jgi:hypothetical protein